MIVAAWLDPTCKLTQPLESDASEGLKAALHVRHVLEWLLFFNSLPLLLALPQIFEEPILQLLLLRLHAGGVIVMVEAPEDVAQVFPPPCTPVVSEVLQRVSRGSPCGTAKLW